MKKGEKKRTYEYKVGQDTSKEDKQQQMRPWRISAWELKHGFKYTVHIHTGPRAAGTGNCEVLHPEATGKSL